MRACVRVRWVIRHESPPSIFWLKSHGDDTDDDAKNSSTTHLVPIWVSHKKISQVTREYKYPLLPTTILFFSFFSTPTYSAEFGSKINMERFMGVFACACVCVRQAIYHKLPLKTSWSWMTVMMNHDDDADLYPPRTP